MKRIFVDASFVIALINQRDQYHQKALALSHKVEYYPLLITDAILLEIGNGLVRGYKQQAIEIIEYYLTADEVEVVNLSPILFKKALDFYKTHQDKDWGIVDCLSFIVMKEAGIEKVLTFDKRFLQAGFQPLL